MHSKLLFYTLKLMVISCHLWISIWPQTCHDLIMHIGGDTLHGADPLRIFYIELSESNLKLLHYKFKPMVFIRINYHPQKLTWTQTGHDLIMNIGGIFVHGALQIFPLRSHLSIILAIKLPPTLNMELGFSSEPIAQIASATQHGKLDGPPLEDYFTSQPNVLESYYYSHVAAVGSSPSINRVPLSNLYRNSATKFLSSTFPGKIIIPYRIFYRLQVNFNEHFSLRTPFSVSSPSLRLTLIGNGPHKSANCPPTMYPVICKVRARPFGNLDPFTEFDPTFTPTQPGRPFSYQQNSLFSMQIIANPPSQVIPAGSSSSLQTRTLYYLWTYLDQIWPQLSTDQPLFPSHTSWRDPFLAQLIYLLLARGHLTSPKPHFALSIHWPVQKLDVYIPYPPDVASYSYCPMFHPIFEATTHRQKSSLIGRNLSTLSTLKIMWWSQLSLLCGEINPYFVLAAYFSSAWVHGTLASQDFGACIPSTSDTASYSYSTSGNLLCICCATLFKSGLVTPDASEYLIS